ALQAAALRDEHDPPAVRRIVRGGLVPLRGDQLLWHAIGGRGVPAGNPPDGRGGRRQVRVGPAGGGGGGGGRGVPAGNPPDGRGRRRQLRVDQAGRADGGSGDVGTHARERRRGAALVRNPEESTT